MLMTINDIEYIKSQCKSAFQYIYVVFGASFQCDMGHDYTLVMFYNCQRDSYSKNRVGYILKHESKVIFKGYDFSAPFGLDTVAGYISAIESILAFLSLTKGDTDSEHFDWYTQEQIDWRDSYAESLGGFSSELTNCLDIDNGYTDQLQFDRFFIIKQGYEVLDLRKVDFNELVNKAKQV